MLNENQKIEPDNIKEFSVDDILNKLSSLDLKQYPFEDIYECLFAMNGILPIIITTIHPGTIIVRGRNYNKNEDFSLARSHSYPPSVYVNSNGRANLIHSSVFYGSINPIDIDGPKARMTILCEIGKTYRKNAVDETIVFSSWEVISPLELVTICSSHLYTSLNPDMAALRKEFCRKYSNFPGFKVIQFLGDEFSKIVDDDKNYEYLITGVFSDIICGCNNYDGVYYPSVQIGGAGMNVALKPEAVNRCLRLLGASEVDFKRNGLEIYETSKRDILIKDLY